MTVIAVLAASRQKQKAVLSWLVPLAVGHGFGLLYELYDLSYRFFHLRPTLFSAEFSYGLLSVGALVGLYTAWRVLQFVTHLPITGTAAQDEGVWPPPPTQTR